MILSACVIVQGTVTTLFTVSSLADTDTKWYKAYSRFENFQVTWLMFQECLISGLYMYHAFILIRSSAKFRGGQAKKVIRHLIAVSALVIFLDSAILGFQYANCDMYQTSWKTFAYSIKLKFEFDVLEQLVILTKSRLGAHAQPHGTGEEGRTGNKGTKEDSGIRLGGSKLGKSSYVRMDKGSDKSVPLQHVTKTTEIRVEYEKNPKSDCSLAEFLAQEGRK